MRQNNQVTLGDDKELAYESPQREVVPLFDSKDNCLVTIPLYEITEIYHKAGTVAFAEEVALRQEVIEELRREGVPVFNSISADRAAVNEVHIGGPLTNDRAHTLFLNHFCNFRYRLNSQTFDALPEKIKSTRADSIDVVDDASKEGYIVGPAPGKLIRFDNVRNDCAILAKLVPSDFAPSVNKTVYFMFGSRLRGTEAAVRYFLEHREYLNTRFGGGHFLVAMDVNNDDATIDFSKAPVDLTDDVFPV